MKTNNTMITGLETDCTGDVTCHVLFNSQKIFTVCKTRDV